MKQRVLSGVQPSGNFTIANYIGAIKQWKNLVQNYDALFCVVDLHSITVRQDPEELRRRTLDFLALYIACGLDPKECTLFIQSHVPEHTELSWVLTTMTQMGEMNRMTQFKDKSKKHADNINVGLFSYPILMAADILLYQTDFVPVGADQKQHVEITRDIGARFNKRYGETFVIPKPYIPEHGARIMSLDDPTAKMSKSSEIPKSYISLLDAPDSIIKKLKSAVTDSEGVVVYDEQRPGVANLMTIMSALTGKNFDTIAKEYDGKGYGVFKQAVAESIIAVVEPIQERYSKLRDDEAALHQILREGAAKAREIATPTLRNVYDKVGFVLS